MKPGRSDDGQNGDLFRSRLDQILNPNHELVLLSKKINWQFFDDKLSVCFSDIGRPAIATRLMIGLHILKYTYELSDEEVVARWVENPYYQYFCGEQYFQHKFPIQRSSMTHWRKRVGEDTFKELLHESLRVAVKSKALKPKQLKKVVVDTTVQPKAIKFPTDSQLRYIAILKLGELCAKEGIQLRQSYKRVCKKALIMSGRYRHAKHIKRAKKQEKFIKVRLGRILRDIRRQLSKQPNKQPAFKDALIKAGIIYEQSRHSKKKLYSWHQPDVECIGKGKADKPYEFGCKASIVTNLKPSPAGHFVLHAEALHGRLFDGHTLEPIMKDYEEQASVKPERIFVDKGYQGHSYEPKSRVFKSGQKRGITPSIKKELKRRSVVEPIIGHLKAHHRMEKNFLHGKLGDKINTLATAMGFNFKLLLKWLANFLVLIKIWFKQTNQKKKPNIEFNQYSVLMG